MATNKKEIEDIDESLLLASIKEQDAQTETVKQPQAEQVENSNPEVEKPRETVKRKRNVPADYGSTFLQKNEFKSRQCVYISRHVHATITEIVRVIADRDVTVGGYIDNVLMQHLETHRDEINERYKKDRKDLI
jgi:hypothetical protein